MNELNRDTKVMTTTIAFFAGIASSLAVIVIGILSEFYPTIFGFITTNRLLFAISSILVAIITVIFYFGFNVSKKLWQINSGISDLQKKTQEIEFLESAEAKKLMDDAISNAKTSVFISGTGMTFLLTDAEKQNHFIKQAKSGIEVTIAITKHDENNAEQHKRSFSKGMDEDAKNMLIAMKEKMLAPKSKKNKIESKHKDKFKPIEVGYVITTAFTAIDYAEKKSGSVIFSKNYLIDKENQTNTTHSFHLRVQPGVPLYEKYLAQINAIKNDGDLIPETNAGVAP